MAPMQIHIKPLFRERDRQAMQSRFDLWSYDDVSRHAEVILTRRVGSGRPQVVWVWSWIWRTTSLPCQVSLSSNVSAGFVDGGRASAIWTRPIWRTEEANVGDQFAVASFACSIRLTKRAL